MSSLLRTFNLSAIGSLLNGGAGIIRQPDRADIFRVIGHRLEVERALELHHVAARDA